MSKVVVVLEGGLVQAVHSDDPTIEFAVLDYDTFEDQYPRLDFGGFCKVEPDPDLTVLKTWQEAKAEFLAMYPDYVEE